MRNKLKLVYLVIAMGFLFFNICLVGISQEYSIDKLTISGGTVGGTSNLMANGIAAIGQEFLKLDCTVISNPTMTQVLVVQEGEADISTSVGYQMYFAYNGTTEWPGEPFPEVRTLYQGTRQAWHMAVMADSEIYSIRDLEGKKVVVGKAGFFSEDATKYLFKALNLDYDAINPSYLGHSDAMAALLNGKVDAYIVVTDPPHPTLTQLCQAHDVRIIGLDEADMKLALENWPGSEKVEFEAGIYAGEENEEVITTAASWMFYCVRNDLPEDVAYGLTKYFWENQDFAGYQYANLAEYSIEDIPKFRTAPYHIGAYKYYQEVGLEIPEGMIPPEAK